MNTRREFLKSGLAFGAAVSLAPWHRLAAATAPIAPATVDSARSVLVAVRDGSRSAMVDQALAALGGLGAWVKPGQTVCLKPNIGWDAPPERGANTHPELVGHLVRLCLGAGAKSVSVFDNTCDQWQLTYEHSGIEKAARDAGAHVVNGKDQSLYREVEIPGGVKLKRALVHTLFLDSDVLLNVPVLKHHSGTGMTAAMKNLMGVIWDRGFWRPEGDPAKGYAKGHLAFDPEAEPTTPTAVRRLMTSSSFMLSLITLFNLAITAGGVPFGANTPYHVVTS